MRMLHYFGVLALLSAVALLATAVTGIWTQGSERHLTTGLVTAVLVLGAHTLLIVFMIVTGRVLRAAMQSRPLGPEFLDELNVFFAKKAAYPAAVLAAFALVVAGVLGYAQRGFGVPSAVHMLVGLTAVLGNLWAFQVEFRALAENQKLLDRAAGELDRIDAEDGQWAEQARAAEAQQPGEASRRWLLVAVSLWCPYLYWGFVTWKGDFSKVSVHPWIELSAFAFLAAWLTRSYVPPAEDEGEDDRTQAAAAKGKGR